MEDTHMSKVYQALTDYLPRIENIKYGKWYPETQTGDGSMERPFQMPFVVYDEIVEGLIEEVYKFEKEHPEYGLNRYHDILKRYDIEWGDQAMTEADVSKMDGQGVMAILLAAIRAERFCDGALLDFLEKGCIQKWLCRLKEIEEKGEPMLTKPMSNIELINDSCADQIADVVVNAANDRLWAGGGICGVIFRKAGMTELTNACKKHQTPVRDGGAVITPAFNMKNAKAIIHAVGPNFNNTPNAFKELFEAYYNSLVVLKDNGYHSISFPLISAGIFGGSLDDPAAESTKQCCRAYKKFVEDYPEYYIDVKLCAFSSNEMASAERGFSECF